MFVLIEDSAQPLSSSDVQVGDLVWFGDRWGQRLQRACVGDALVRPMLVAEGLELAKGGGAAAAGAVRTVR